MSKSDPGQIHGIKGKKRHNVPDRKRSQKGVHSWQIASQTRRPSCLDNTKDQFLENDTRQTPGAEQAWRSVVSKRAYETRPRHNADPRQKRYLQPFMVRPKYRRTISQRISSMKDDQETGPLHRTRTITSQVDTQHGHERHRGMGSRHLARPQLRLRQRLRSEYSTIREDRGFSTIANR